MATVRLPNPGGDDGQWGSILNSFLAVEHNPDGSLKRSNDIAAALSNSITALSNSSTALTTANNVNSVAVKTVNGKSPNGSGAVTLAAGDISGIPTTLAALSDVSVPGVSDSQVLSYNGTTNQWTAATVTSTTVSDASASAKGIVQLTGDLGGTAASPTVAKVQGVAISAAPTGSGQVLTSTGMTGAAWSTPATSPVTSVAGKTGSVTLASTDVGLGNVDNTSDATKNAATATLTNKTISGATNTLSNIPQAAVVNLTTDLAAKANSSSLAAVALSGSYTDLTNKPAAASDATTTSKGVVQLAGDLGGTATSPTVAKVQGITIAATAPTGSGQVLTSTGTTGAAWSTPAAAAVTSVAGKTGSVTLTSTDVGLGNVNNTSDVNKPVSTAQQAAITAALSTTYAIINYNTTSGSWPLRNTVTSDTTRPVRWRGPSSSPPPTTAGYAISGVDEWGVTP